VRVIFAEPITVEQAPSDPHPDPPPFRGREKQVAYPVFAGALASHKSPRQRIATASIKTTPSAA
jgi:hypothetical protein